MTDRPSEIDLALDGIDDAFKQASGQIFRNLTSYGVAPVRTFEDAVRLAREAHDKSQRARFAAIAIVTGAK